MKLAGQPLFCGPLWPFVAVLISAASSIAAQQLAQIELVTQTERQKVFGGGQRSVSLMWRNLGDDTAKAPISMRLFQASSATAVPLREAGWKTLEILGGQNILETATLDFPVVRAETRFFVQWVQQTNHVLGITEVWVYPTNILQELSVLADQRPLGVFDPQNRLKPLLQALNVEFVESESIVSKTFASRLAVLGPFESKTHLQEELPAAIEELAKRGIAVVWILPPDLVNELKPSFYPVPMGKGMVVVAAPSIVDDLAMRPQAQLNLVELCRLALHPKPLTLPLLTSQP